METALDTVDPAARKVTLDDAQAYIFENSYVLMMYARGNVYGSTPRFQFGPAGPESDLNWNAETWDVTE